MSTVDLIQYTNGLFHLRLSKVELCRPERVTIETRTGSQVSSVKMQQRPRSFAGLKDLCTWSTAIPMLNRRNNESTACKFSSILRVVRPRAGHAVREYHDREAARNAQRVDVEIWRL